jgi:hypothetical protein
MDKPIASLSLDLDNKWSYLKTHGDRGWESFPSYLDVLIPRVLDFFKARNLIITFFIVGQDAALEKHYDLFRAIAVDGHEIGNHSFHHEPWLQLYSVDEIKTELSLAEEHIERATGQRPIGFRGPGYSLSQPLLKELIRRGYEYDTSTLPSLLEPLARAYYYTTASLSREQRAQLTIGGSLRNGFRSIRPYRWRLNCGNIIELPVTTLPVFRLPIHFSYLLCVSVFSPALALGYFNTALTLCRLKGVEPSLVLHPTDFLGCDDTRDLSFFPAMMLPSEKKLELLNDCLHKLGDKFAVSTLRQHIRQAIERCELPVIEPNFRQPSSIPI